MGRQLDQTLGHRGDAFHRHLQPVNSPFPFALKHGRRSDLQLKDLRHYVMRLLIREHCDRQSVRYSAHRELQKTMAVGGIRAQQLSLPPYLFLLADQPQVTLGATFQFCVDVQHRPDSFGYASKCWKVFQ